MSRTPEVVKTELLLLGTEMGLALSQLSTLDEIREAILSAAKRQPPPHTPFSIKVATENNIVFGKDLADCFGLWEKHNEFCMKCPDQEKCNAVALSSGLGGIAVPAINKFNANDDHAGLRTSRKLESVRAPKTESRQVEADRNAIIAWIDENFLWLVKRVYKESATYKLPSQNQAILKVESFSQRNYYVHFSQIATPMAVEMGLITTKYGWYNYSPDMAALKLKIKPYLDSIKLKTTSGAPVEFGGLREDLIAYVESMGCTLDVRIQFQTVLDPLKFKVMYFEKFTPKSLTTCFVRWMKPDEPMVVKYGLTISQYGAYYRGNDPDVLKELIKHYVEKVLLLNKKT